MPFTISIPDHLKSIAQAVKALVQSTEQAIRRAAGGRALEYARVEREVGERAAEVERAAHESVLASLDVDAPSVVIDGRIYTQVHRTEGRYYTLAGDVVIERSLYRAERNGKVVDPISLRIGAIEGGWLPETATACAHLIQQNPSREAEQTAHRLGRLPYSRSSFERVGHEVGRLYASKKTEIDDALIVSFQIPKETRTVSFAIDRVSLPMEEPRPRPVGRPQKNAPKRPVQRVYRMAYCTTVTFHDETGEALHTIRQGAVPSVEPAVLCDRMLADAVAILEQRPGLEVVLLSDGAPEMRNILRAALNEETLGKKVHELLDLWHLLEKLAAAAGVIYGEAQIKSVVAAWRIDLLNRNAAPDDILTELKSSGREYVRVGKKRPVHEAITYLENHRDLLGYPGARRRGLPVGSGAVEASCKSLFQIRMNRSGARWKEETARDVINLRALALSDRWESALQLALAPLRRAVRVAA
jgi:hypothetical protein